MKNPYGPISYPPVSVRRRDSAFHSAGSADTTPGRPDRLPSRAWRALAMCAALPLYVFTQTGCCSLVVNGMANHVVRVEQKGVWANDQGLAAIELNCTDRSHYGLVRRPRGRRYVIAPQTEWTAWLDARDQAEAADKNNPERINRMRPQAIPSTNLTAFATTKFILYPEGLDDYRRVRLPAEQGPWHPVDVQRESGDLPACDAALQRLKGDYDDIPYFTGRDHMYQRHDLSIWLLYVPAAAVDIVTFPIQFMILYAALDGAG